MQIGATMVVQVSDVGELADFATDASSLVTSELLAAVPGVVHAFSGREVGAHGASAGPFEGESREHSEARRQQLLSAVGRPDATWVSLRQVHGDAILQVTRQAGRALQGDGIWTRDPAVALAVLVADCVPILVTSRGAEAVAAVHAGWKGTRLHIAARMVERLVAGGIKPGALVVALGPAIGPCCFDIGPDVADALSAAYPQHGAAIGVRPDGRYFADLWLLNEQSLVAAGVDPGAIDIIRRCTVCDRAFFSYRREGRGCGRQAGVIALARRPIS